MALTREQQKAMFAKQARTLGVKAFSEGKERVPALDRNLTMLLKEKKIEIDEAQPILKSWLSGWDTSNIKDEPIKTTETGTGDPHEIPQIILDQLNESRVNGFPFFKYTGIKGFVMIGNEQLMLKQIPKNPNHISSITIAYNDGEDLYDLLLQKGKFPRNLPVKRVTGVFFDQLAEIIAREMGVL